MAGRHGAGTRRRSPAAALEAGREHLGAGAGDKPAGESEESAGNQGAGDGQAGDKPGEFARISFTLDDMQRTALADARESDGGGEAGKAEEEAFWRAAADRLGFNPATVEEADDFEDSGEFTAYPKEAAEPAFSPATNEADHTAGVERIEGIADDADLVAGTLAGDLRDCMLDIFRNRHKPWGALSSTEQRDVATAIDYSVKTTLAKAVRIIAQDGRSSITATLDKYADKGGEITATIKIVGADDQTVLALHRASGKAVLIVSADAAAYEGQRGEPAIEPDDPELAFDAGSDGERPPKPPADSSDLADAGDKVVDDEALYRRAVQLVRENDNASASWLQRQLELGWNAASSIVARMEAEGVVSAPDVTTKRTVLPFEPAGGGESGESGDESNSEAREPAEVE